MRQVIRPHEVIRLGFLRWQVVLRASTHIVVPIKTFWLKHRAVALAEKMNDAFQSGYNYT